MWKRYLMWIGWPAFLAAGVMEMLVFAMFDPRDMLWLGQSAEIAPTTVYTLAFFVFWGVFLVAGYVMMLLSLPQTELNATHSLS